MSEIKELEGNELEGLLKFNKRAAALFFYTPFCGTCKLAYKMLTIASEVVHDVPIYKCNVNTMGKFVQMWEISSVPCLVYIRGNQIIKKQYALHSVADVYQDLKSLETLSR